MNVKLTRRQAEFVERLIALNRDLERPIHYSVLAEDLGVSPFTAYDMLRLLEEKGLVTSVYQLPEDRGGPGRAERVFYATDKGKAHRQRVLALAEGAGPALEDLPDLLRADLCGDEMMQGGLALELLAEAAGADGGVSRYGLELMAIVALRLHSKPARDQFQALLTAVLPLNQPTAADDLTLLGGYALGFLAGEEAADSEWVRVLAAHVRHYQDYVRTLSAAECAQLGDDIRAVLARAWAVASHNQ
jgi:DNA-binding PadR family transcriptional regulator